MLFTAKTQSGSYDDASAEVISIKTGERRTVAHGGFFARYLALSTGTGPGYLVYLHLGTLLACRSTPAG